VAALSAALESTFQSAVIAIQIYKKVTVNHQIAALKQTQVIACATLVFRVCVQCHLLFIHTCVGAFLKISFPLSLQALLQPDNGYL